MNPLEFAYSELNNPKHMKLPKVKLMMLMVMVLLTNLTLSQIHLRELRLIHMVFLKIQMVMVFLTTEIKNCLHFKTVSLLMKMVLVIVLSQNVVKNSETWLERYLVIVRLTDFPSVQFKGSSVKIIKRCTSYS